MVYEYKEELLSRLGKLISINSVEGTPEPDAPFGKGPKVALETALEMMKADGFDTVNLDNYIGYAEIGSGEKLIGIIGHLDVVPANVKDGWDSDPFEMVEKDGVLYGRGVSDDKGAMVASMIALKVIKDMNIPLTKRIRLIFGTNEETGSKCLKHYVEKEGSVDYGFTPDGDFPGVHGEKGMIAMRYLSKNTAIKDIQGGAAKNIVCRNCYVVIDKNSFSRKTLEDYFNNENLEFSIENIDENDVKISVQGIAAHASLPELGKNALSYLMDGLKQNGVIEGSIDIRFPVTLTSRKVLKLMEGHLEDENGVIEVLSAHEPLFFPIDSPLVSALCSAYREVTGDKEAQPITLGGGTYAKGIDNTIAFGCAFQGKDYHIHDANEYVEINELLLQAEIYVAAILKFLEI